MVFSANVPPDKKQAIMALWNASQIQQYEKYLGLPPMVGRSKTQAFSEIKHKVWQRLQGWKHNLFSQGGREVLLQSLALAIPSYAMSCFKLPSTLCTDIERMMAHSWWGQKKGERKIHWQSWNSMCKSKSLGGIGFKELEVFNMAMLGKQAWRLMQYKNSLLHKIYSARYFPDGNVLKASIGGNPSYTWRGKEAKNLLLQGGRWIVGNGTTIHILKDKWIPGISDLSRELRANLQQHYYRHADCPVASLIDPHSRWWDLAKLRALFNPKLVEAILKLHPSHLGEEDFWVWEHEKSGIYSVSSAYNFFRTCLAPDRGTCSNASKRKKF
ncbi:unnamed protein product [Fraxinus pennsylvanica]|uniref:Uncharacterized protein n=1 Tax=Fraxinus pennsylvanica TaxID=56036 RepID=A0AAD1ZKF5_9LAMI|nr:unnamed protein product [Fraxinus pennsylvanica]